MRPGATAGAPKSPAVSQNKPVRSFGPQARARLKGEGLAVLTKALEDKDGDLRVEVVVALRLAGKDGVPPLRAALKDKVVDVRLNAADSLGRMGSAAKEAVPGLAVALSKDESKDVRA